MNREIKFRAWDKHQNRMLSVVSNPDTQGKREWYPFEVQVGFVSFDENDIELMQFTGLHDKNGKEIYEGDILQVVAIQMEVKWRLEKADWYLFQISEGHFAEKLTLNKALGYEVIGNIYENPDLLTHQPRIQ